MGKTKEAKTTQLALQLRLFQVQDLRVPEGRLPLALSLCPAQSLTSGDGLEPVQRPRAAGPHNRSGASGRRTGLVLKAMSASKKPIMTLSCAACFPALPEDFACSFVGQSLPGLLATAVLGSTRLHAQEWQQEEHVAQPASQQLSRPRSRSSFSYTSCPFALLQHLEKEGTLCATAIYKNDK